MKLPKLFQKDRFKHELLSFFSIKKVSIVGTSTSVTKMISRKYKFHVLKRKITYFFNPQKFLLARSNAKRHSSSIWVVMFNLTIFCIRENSIFLFRTQRSC